MKPTGHASKSLALWLGLALVLPSPASALRTTNLEETQRDAKQRLVTQLAGLEERRLLRDVVNLDTVRVIAPRGAVRRLARASTVLMTLDAGKGTRFVDSWDEATMGPRPASKVVAPLAGKPAGWWTKAAAEALVWPVIAIVGHAADQVMAAYNAQTQHGVIYVESEDPAGGTGYAFYHAAAVKGLRNSNALVIATLGDRPLFDRDVLEAVERTARTSGADLVIASAIFDDPKGKGRIVRERGTDRILGILEQRDIEGGMTLGGYTTDQLLAIREGNVSIYAMPAHPFFQSLAQTTNANAQREFYVTDLVKMIIDRGGRIEAVRIPAEKAPDITTVDDLAKAEAVLARQAGLEEVMVTQATPEQVQAIRASLAQSPLQPEAQTYVHFVYQWPEGIARRMLAAEGVAEQLAERGILVETDADETRFLLPIVATDAPALPGALYVHLSLFPNGTIYGGAYTPLARDVDGVQRQLTNPDPVPQAFLFDERLVGTQDLRPETYQAVPAVVANPDTVGHPLMPGEVASLVALARRLDGALLVVRTLTLVTVDERQYLLVRTQA